jgi:S1-C subfamily serine protease
LIHAGHNIVFAAYFTAMLLNLVFTPIFGIHGDDQSGRIVVTHVRPLATADLAGLQADDVVVRFDGLPVTNIDVLHQYVKAKKVGQHVPVVVLRDGRQITLDVVMYNRFTSPVQDAQELAADE